MALDLWGARDIRRNIVAVAVAMLSASAAHGNVNSEYIRGVLDTSRAQGLNFGISWAELLGELRAAMVNAGQGEVLDALVQNVRKEIA